jgi:hypothetical protein
MIKEIEDSIADYNSATMSSAFATRDIDRSDIWYSDDTNFESKC